MSLKEILLGAVILGAMAGYVWPRTPPVARSPEERAKVEQSVYYAGCDEVRDAGKAPLYAGQPGYREGMDGDGDGVACEPYRGG